jgi:Uma2 family endonuclease
MAALPQLVTVAEFRELPEGGNFAYELHHGEVVAVTRPKAGHWKLQARLRRLLESKLRDFGEVAVEMPYRPLAEFEFRAADVGVLSWARCDALDPDSDLFGAPELVIEVKSPSSTRIQLRKLVTLCLANGAIECWIVDTKKRSVTVMRRDGSPTVYASGDRIPLTAFGSDSLAVDEIFATSPA